jgi:hypothetical protein
MLYSFQRFASMRAAIASCSVDWLGAIAVAGIGGISLAKTQDTFTGTRTGGRVLICVTTSGCGGDDAHAAANNGAQIAINIRKFLIACFPFGVRCQSLL